jgi:hypothetical protein
MIVTALTAVAGTIKVEINRAAKSFLIMLQLSRGHRADRGCDTYFVAENLMRF